MRPERSALAAACLRGATQGRELADLGVTMNLAPVLDVWDNPQNTVIAYRSYSDDPWIAARLGAAYVDALQAQGILAIGKHFPGHGSSATDSHQTLPVVDHDRAWLEGHELVPFRAAIRAGVAGLMTAHVSYPAIEPDPDRAASLSWHIVTGLLRDELDYDGLVVTDDLGAMRAITAHFEPGEAAVQAVLAGADMLVVVGPVSTQQVMIQALTAQVGHAIPTDRLDASVRRILRAKQRVGLLGPRPTALPAAAACSNP